MPAYPGAGQAQLLHYNQQAYFYNGETIPAAEASVAYQLQRVQGNSYPWGFAVEVTFGGAPGTFEIDIEAAETDIDASYISIAKINAVNSSNVGRADITSATPFYGKYIRLLHKTFPNSVTTTALVTR